MSAIQEEVGNSSSRLLEMLRNNPNLPSEKNGLCKALCEQTGFSYSTTHKWLYQDALPRTPAERQKVSEQLDIDLIYWEYGYRSDPELPDAQCDSPLFHMQIANKVMTLVQQHNLTVEDEKLVEIELLAADIFSKNNAGKIDNQLIERLIYLTQK